MFVFSKVSVSFDFFIFRTKPERIEAILGIRKKIRLSEGFERHFNCLFPPHQDDSGKREVRWSHSGMTR